MQIKIEIKRVLLIQQNIDNNNAHDQALTGQYVKTQLSPPDVNKLESIFGNWDRHHDVNQIRNNFFANPLKDIVPEIYTDHLKLCKKILSGKFQNLVLSHLNINIVDLIVDYYATDKVLLGQGFVNDDNSTNDIGWDNIG